jgi:hypothetical protein
VVKSIERAGSERNCVLDYFLTNVPFLKDKVASKFTRTGNSLTGLNTAGETNDASKDCKFGNLAFKNCSKNFDVCSMTPSISACVGALGVNSGKNP